jgi:DNA-directed RNA polymerase specialized sigma24 family protein
MKAAPAAPAETPAREAVSADRRKQVLAMAEQGYSVTEIAKATGSGKGEIMLLLQLNKK